MQYELLTYIELIALDSSSRAGMTENKMAEKTCRLFVMLDLIFFICHFELDDFFHLSCWT